jgi:hypothetical protein
LPPPARPQAASQSQDADASLGALRLLTAHRPADVTEFAFFLAIKSLAATKRMAAATKLLQQVGPGDMLMS